MRRFVPAMAAAALLGVFGTECAWADRPQSQPLFTEQEPAVSRVSGKDNLVLHPIDGPWKLPAAMPTLYSLSASAPGSRKQPVVKEEPEPPFHARLGLMLTPNVRLAGGFDYSMLNSSRLGLRLDAEAILDAGVGGSATVFPVTIGVVSRSATTELFEALPLQGYVGAGVGPYIAKQTRFGGKLFAGLEVARIAGVEMGVHFPGSGDVLLTLQLRTIL